MSQKQIHLMSQIDGEKLSNIPANWNEVFFQKFKIPNAVIKFELKKLKKGLKHATKFLGFSLELRRKSGLLKCAGSSICKGEFKIDVSAYKSQVKKSLDIYRGELECLEFHTCERYQCMKKAVEYAGSLHKYIALNNFKSDSLKSYIGFLYQRTETLNQMRMFAFDHDLKAQTGRGNMVSCTRYACNCGINVYKTTRDNNVCHLISPSGKGSKILSAYRFNYESDADIPSMHSKCISPFYIFTSGKHSTNVFSYDLHQLLPDLPTFIEVFGWDRLYEKSFEGNNDSEDDDVVDRASTASSLSNIADLDDFSDVNDTVASQSMEIVEIEDESLANWLEELAGEQN